MLLSVQASVSFERWSPSFFASVRICMGTISPLTSIHKTLRNKHVPKHFMSAFNSATVVD